VDGLDANHERATVEHPQWCLLVEV